MPAKDDHLNQAHHNFQFYQSVNSSQYPDWAITALFYTALHYIDAYLATLPLAVHPSNHGMRDNCMSRLPALRAIYNEYSFLKSHCHTARYYPPAPFNQATVTGLETNQLAPLTSSLQPYL